MSLFNKIVTTSTTPSRSFIEKILWKVHWRLCRPKSDKRYAPFFSQTYADLGTRRRHKRQDEDIKDHIEHLRPCFNYTGQGTRRIAINRSLCCYGYTFSLNNNNAIKQNFIMSQVIYLKTYM